MTRRMRFGVAVAAVLGVATAGTVIATKTGNRQSAAPTLSPSPLASIATPSPSASPSPSPSPSLEQTDAPSSQPSTQRRSLNRAPKTFRRHGNVFADNLTIGLGDVWARDPAYAKVHRFDARSGADKGTISPNAFVDGFIFDGTGHSYDNWMVADESGVWLSGRTKEAIVRTKAAGRCPSVARTGPRRDGPGVLVRFSAATLCPTKLISYGSRWDDPGARLGWQSGRLWLGVGLSMSRVNSDGSFTKGLGYELAGSGFGSIWGQSGSSGGSVESVEIVRVDPVTGVARLVAGSTFFARCGASPYDVQCLGYEPEFFWIDPRTDRKHALYEGEGCCHTEGAFTSSLDHVFLGRSDIRVWHKKSGRELNRIHLSSAGPIVSLAAYEGVLWASTSYDNGSSLWWLNVEQL